LRGLEATMDQAEKSSGSNAALRGTPERIVMDPTPRSRLRWLDAP
jgi:hypothetical protein